MIKKKKPGVGFDKVLKRLREGRSVRRIAWREGWSVFIKMPARNNSLRSPYIAVSIGDGIIPWIPSYTDLLAEDWEIL